MTDILQKLDAVEQILQTIAKRPDLPNPERDADWKNCQKISSYEASEAISYISEIRAALEGMQWQDISTAPKDGTEILVLLGDDNGKGIISAYWEGSLGWMDNARGSFWGFEPIAWQPLPTPPKGGLDGHN